MERKTKSVHSLNTCLTMPIFHSKTLSFNELASVHDNHECLKTTRKMQKMFYQANRTFRETIDKSFALETTKNTIEEISNAPLKKNGKCVPDKVKIIYYGALQSAISHGVDDCNKVKLPQNFKLNSNKWTFQQNKQQRYYDKTKKNQASPNQELTILEYPPQKTLQIPQKIPKSPQTLIYTLLALICLLFLVKILF